MNCPTCNAPMSVRSRTHFEEIDTRKWVYEYEECFCEQHPEQGWQTGHQLQAELDAIRGVRESAEKLKKVTTLKEKPRT